jgi:tetratricopeptide (TPR) repeat protein/predicted Ser/Thr protein kinase
MPGSDALGPAEVRASNPDPGGEEELGESPERPIDTADRHLALLLQGVRGEFDRSTAEPAPLRGRTLDRYLVLGKLGQGGMGTVLKAYDESLDRAIAIKLLHSEAAERHALRLQREAQALAKLSHPNIVHVYEVGESQGQWFIAMELVPGQTLRQWGQQATRTWREHVKVYLQAGEGLAAAHAAGLVHRDFKPDNVMLGDDGRVRVMDFGLARFDEPEAAVPDSSSEGDADEPTSGTKALGTPLTRTGVLLGTPRYMAPEQWLGKPADVRTDQFSLCVALWEALYGEPPFAGASANELSAQVLAGRRRPPAKDRRVPGRLQRACERGLSVDPYARWPSMEALLGELRTLAAPRRARWMAASMTVGLLAVGAGLGLERYAAWASRCAGARAHLEGIWDDERKQQVGAAILATELAYAADTWERVEQRLDQHAEAWVAKHTEVCEATRVQEEQSEEEMSLRMSCMLDRKLELRAAVGVLAAADVTVVENAVELVAGLRGLSRCDDLEALRAEVPPPEDPQAAQEVEALREQLAKLEAQEKAGVYVQPLEEVERVVERAIALGSPPRVAEATLRRGSLREKNGRYAEAEKDLTEAYVLAVEHRHEHVALEAVKPLGHVVGYRENRPAEGSVWGQAAMAVAKRSGEDIEIAEVLGNMSSLFLAQGDYEQGKLHQERALQIEEKVLGPDHPQVAVALNNLGLTLFVRGEREQARLHIERGLRVTEEALGPDHPNVAQGLKSLGTVLHSQGEREQAKLHIERALQIEEKVLGPDHPDVAATLNNLGAILHMQGEQEQAKLHIERALQIWEKTLGPDHPDLASSLIALCFVALAQDDFAAVEAHATRALTIREASNVGPELIAEARFMLARPLWNDEPQRVRAYELAKQARDAWAALGKGHEERLVEVEAWLAEHRVQ